MAGRDAGGPETYEHGLVRQLVQLDTETEYRIFCFSQRAADSFGVVQPNLRYQILSPSFRPFSVAVSLPRSLKAHGVDLMHAACVPPLFSPVDYVSTLHCSSTFIHPEYYPPLVRWRLKVLVRQGMRHARHTLCVSQNVLDLAADHFRVPRERMSVIYNGIGEHFAPIPEAERAPVLARFGIRDPYVLFVGRCEPRKNVTRLLEAFHAYRHEVDRGIKLVLAGNKTWAGPEIDRTVERLSLRSHVIEPGYVPQVDLPALYNGAEFLAFPSLWEGFGIPVVEAMACGTPVLTSNLSSLPEIAAGAAVLVDPLSVEEIAAGMQRIGQDDELRARLRQRGLERARDFSWRRTAEQTLAVYRRLTA
jgi:glycosyltransferase involved in cell wall biosynthesis